MLARDSVGSAFSIEGRTSANTCYKSKDPNIQQ